MPLDVIIGAQWGDEGKGRITDLLASESHLVIRSGGGDNAGHSVQVGDTLYQLHLIPSGIIHPHTTCLMGAGMVINPVKFIQEWDLLKSLGVDVAPARLKISLRAHLITPTHILLDGAQEESEEHRPLGTTKRGIGPAYADKSARRGLRVEDMLDEKRFALHLREHLCFAKRHLQDMFHISPPDEEEIIKTYLACASRMRPHITDVSLLVQTAMLEGKNALAEGAQGTLLDLDFGTYPFVTSSHPTTSGALQGIGIAPRYLRRVIGVTKSFQTRVGEGPFPTELQDEIADRLRGTGANPWDEFGTTTGRPRRCGWLDGVLLKYAHRINGFTELAVTKLDILAGIDPLKICVAYHHGGARTEEMDIPPSLLETCLPEYEELAGWSEDISSVQSWGGLPPAAQAYVERIENLVGVRATHVSVGPERSQVIRRS
jgi:adenylosuccinate synthase